MTNFIIKRFIKNYEDVRNKDVRKNYGLLSSIVGIILYIFLFALKIIVGLLLNSISIIADAFNNLADAAVSIVTFLGFKLSTKPPDAKHPFGYGRIEYIAAFIISFFIMLTGYEFFKLSVNKIINPDELDFNILGLFILVLSILCNLWLSIFNKKIGIKINSDIPMAMSLDSRNDCFITAFTIMSILFTRIFNIVIDGYVGLLVSILIFYSGFKIAKETLSPILGEPIDNNLAKEIKDMLKDYNEILGSHDLIVHNYGANTSMATIHVELPNNLSVEESDRIIEKAEKEIGKKLGITLIIHVDGVNMEDERLDIIKGRIMNLSDAIDTRLDAHDFRITDTEENIANVIFELTIPHSYTKEEAIDIEKKMIKAVKEIDKNYNCIIKVEHGYLNL